MSSYHIYQAKICTDKELAATVQSYTSDTHVHTHNNTVCGKESNPLRVLSIFSTNASIHNFARFIHTLATNESTSW